VHQSGHHRVSTSNRVDPFQVSVLRAEDKIGIHFGEWHQARGYSSKCLQWVLQGLRNPSPPLETQKQIVADIEAEQTLVAANRELIVRFEKKIQGTIDRVWGQEAPPTERA